MERTAKRKRCRLPMYDYSENGAYFVTICTDKKRKCLSDVSRGGVLSRPFGKVVENELLALSERYEVVIDKYIIMPNHIHILLTVQRAGQSPAPTHNLSGVIGAFKSRTTEAINQMMNTPGRKLWQRSYFDHVIRNEADYLRIWQYIDDNPAHWAEDEYYI